MVEKIPHIRATEKLKFVIFIRFVCFVFTSKGRYKKIEYRSMYRRRTKIDCPSENYRRFGVTCNP
jgi:hypothetical protein